MTTTTNTPLGTPDDGGSAEPYDTGKDMETFEQLDKGEGAGGGEGKGEGEGGGKEDEVRSVDEMMGEDDKGKEGEIPKDDLEEELDEDEGEGEGDEDEDLDEEGEDKGKEKETPEPPEPTDEDTLHTRPSYGQVKKAFPDIFKKFPELRSMLFREPEFSKIFPTVKEARETASYADNARAIEVNLMQGESADLLKSMKDASPDILAKFVENLPNTLYEVSQESYVKMTTPVIRNAVILARQHARGAGDKDLWNGLDHLEKFLFGDPHFSLKKEAPREDPLKEERERLQAERQSLQQQSYRSFEGRVVNRSQSLLRKEIGRGLDPQNSLTPRMRDMLVTQAMEEISGRMDKDTAHLSAMNRLWKAAAQARLSGQSEEQLIRAYLSRARPLIGPVRRKLLSEVIGRGEDKGKPRVNPNPPRVPAGRTRGQARAPLSSISPKQVDYDKTSDEDILSGKVTLKK